MDDRRFRTDRGGDPIAELARLIAQADTHDGSVPSDNRSREEPVSNQPYAAEAEYRDSEVPPYAAEEEHQDHEVPRVRGHRLTLAVAIFGLALAGTACAVGYRNMFDGSVSPTLPPSVKAINEQNTIPSVSDPQVASSGNTHEVGPAATGSIDNMISREDQPAAVGPPKAAARASLPRASAPAMPGAGHAAPKQAVPRAAVTASGPRLTIAAAPQRPGQSGSADDTAASNHEHLAAVPVANANSDTAAVTAPVVASGYAVQVTSERSESRAQAAFRALQAKYPNQLSGHQPIIRRADLGAAGIYYRALVGPFASAEKAAKMCSGLKAAGGDCIIQKN